MLTQVQNTQTIHNGTYMGVEKRIGNWKRVIILNVSVFRNLQYILLHFLN